MATHVIVGGGLAGAKAAETLRAEGFDGRVVLIAAEAELPYERPPLSKGYLLGSAEREKARVHDAGWYEEHDVELRAGVRATGLDAAGHTVALDTGEELGYDRLLLATGSSARRLTLPGADLDGVRYLRTLPDSDRLLADLAGGGRRVVVVGGGWIGLEVGAAARGYGNEVTVVEPQPTPLHAALGAEMGEVFAGLHREHGVDVRTGTGVRELRGAGGRVTSVLVDGDAEVPADLVVVGIGAVPNTELAEAAGLEVDRGIVTDAALRTSAPDVFAAGDVASSFHPLYGRHVRVEHWANALNGGPAAARSMLGQAVSYDRVPYFFTDQYDLGMEYSGLGGPDDAVVCRGDVGAREFIAFWLSEGRVVAGMNVNVWDVTDPIQALIRSGAQVPVERLTDPAVPLEDLAG
ncbi:FAD-dependent oxidoreductase [Blastococcus jejuensis]|uniref:FAD-dependent oxidoreductase n=1 Tax=Blastococcus jejuensis TaxID=351224 RepID=A0ABP6PKK8_9ACTN